jgi:hypothetical protein
VIQLARVILSHTLGESYSILRVKRNVGLLTARLITYRFFAPYMINSVAAEKRASRIAP